MKGSILPVIYICIASSCCLSGGCDDAMEYPPKMAVIEGTFSSEGYPVVLFSSSVVPAEEGNISDALINWGKVTISDGEREVILSGRKDNSFLPRFYYYSQAITGEPGKTYTVRARFKDLYAESTVRMPFPTAIDSITFSSTDVDTLRATTVHFTSPSDVPAYYYITLHNPVRGSHPMPCLMGTISAVEPDRHYSLAVLRPRRKRNGDKDPGNVTGDRYIAQLAVGEEWILCLNRVEKRVYDFWQAYDNMILFYTSPFISTGESLPTNISGGYGIWSPQGTSSMYFIVK